MRKERWRVIIYVDISLLFDKIGGEKGMDNGEVTRRKWRSTCEAWNGRVASRRREETARVDRVKLTELSAENSISFY